MPKSPDLKVGDQYEVATESELSTIEHNFPSGSVLKISALSGDRVEFTAVEVKPWAPNVQNPPPSENGVKFEWSLGYARDKLKYKLRLRQNA